MSSTELPPASQVSQQEKKRRMQRNVIAALAAVLVFVIVAFSVSVLRKPGQMGAIESQSMDMAKMRPPTGAVPVGIATVNRSEISGQVTYTGTVQAYDDEDIYPRITGRIVRMPVYPGDRVRQGQLLVQLDPPEHSEYLAKAKETQFSAQAAHHQVDIARNDFLEKKYQSESAQQAVLGAQKALDQAKDNLAYWEPEIEREKSLLAQSVIAQQEYDNELAQYKQATDKVVEAQAKLDETKSNQAAAKAAAEGMLSHIGHQQEEAKMATAISEAANIVQSYTRIIASEDGVVTKRLISPGVVVSPGMLIMKIAHIKRVRVQAEVSNSDIQKIALSAPVEIKHDIDADEATQANVTAIFPAADPTSRTTIVEALMDNVGSRFLPGQYLVMNISTGSRMALTVPGSAIVWSGDHAQVWKAVGSADRKTAQLVDVHVGLSNAGRTEIKSGLQEGDQVIFAGQSDLQQDMPVIAVEWGVNGPAKLPSAAQAAGARLDADNHWSLKQTLDGMLIKISMSPVPPKANSNKMVLKLTSLDGAGISGAKIRAKTSMPTMSMTGPELEAQTGPDGTAELSGNFMTTIWEVKLSIAPPARKTVETTVDVEVP
jgi:RND family efflux transporter MFP subunit